jgi:hypothetical protein
MRDRSGIVAFPIAFVFAVLFASLAALCVTLTESRAWDETRYPDLKGQWRPIGDPVRFDPSKSLGRSTTGALDSRISGPIRRQPQGSGRWRTGFGPDQHLHFTRHAEGHERLRPDRSNRHAAHHLHHGRAYQRQSPHLDRWTRLPHGDRADLPRVFHRHVHRYGWGWPLRRARSRDARLQGSPHLR